MKLISFTLIAFFVFVCKAVPTDTDSPLAEESTTSEPIERHDVGYGANKNTIKCPPGGCVGGPNGGNGTGTGGGGGGGGNTGVGGGNLIASLVTLVITILAQVLNVVVVIVQSLLGLEGVTSLLGSVLCNTLPGVLGVVTNLINIIGATLNNITG